MPSNDPLLNAATDWAVIAIFGVVYLGMFLGGLPRLRLDRSGVALLGAIAVIAVSGMGVAEAAQAIDLPTILLLFAFMVISAQMRLGGFYAALTQRVGALPLSDNALLAALIAVAATLSAVFSNDVVCLAMTPIVARLCLRRGANPLPFLIGLACAANIGSAATLIGNPQNMLIGSVLRLDFAGYARAAVVPVLISLALLWGWLVCVPHVRVEPLPATDRRASDPPLDMWQTTKGLVVAGALMGLFLFRDGPHEVMALVGAALLLLSRRLASADFLRQVDWPLLILFMGLFVVNHAFERTGLSAGAVAWLAGQGVRLTDPGPLMVVGVVLSNLVSNVPAVMLLLPHLSGEPGAGVLLALVTTFAGNLLLVGSIANLIVADLARAQGIVIDWRRHAVVGAPVTLLSLGVIWIWLRWGA
ncbi:MULTISPECIES: SLC13 family permease [unclassified Hydrogenophaga]|uniref:SLC13 family permease n=1 Tax=unclassified Hydrogenophaga TaxID=2610897 RepID=UPI00096430BB|nr:MULTISPECIES: SLC13 family permease [unclassified Hydrogenophaga]MBN9371838.1 anion transporter [Hydrogenophaga sp.]OJV40624.1 MAG: anion transporter [Hydrogenophaga sp. 70-12]